jgi:uncharacterized damage-inducible protein DinB
MPALPLDALRELLRHMEWADASVWRAALAHQAAREDARMRQLLVHLHGVQRAFLAMWREQPLTAFPTIEDSATAEAIAAWARAYYAELTDALPAFDEQALARPIVMPWLAQYEQQLGRRFDAPTLAETMLQVASHSTYHRGQVNMRLREVGGEPPLVDYIAWIWFQRPAPEWSV